MMSDNKLKHSVEVARNCVKLGKELGLSQSTLDALFVMGFLHDIGYETLGKDHVTEHPQRSYEMITNFVQEVDNVLPAIKRHGRCYDNMSLFDYILNYSDLVTNHKGENVTVRDWIKKGKGIPAHKIGKKWKFKYSELDAWVKSGQSAIE